VLWGQKHFVKTSGHLAPKPQMLFFQLRGIALE